MATKTVTVANMVKMKKVVETRGVMTVVHIRKTKVDNVHNENSYEDGDRIDYYDYSVGNEHDDDNGEGLHNEDSGSVG